MFPISELRKKKTNKWTVNNSFRATTCCTFWPNRIDSIRGHTANKTSLHAITNDDGYDDDGDGITKQVAAPCNAIRKAITKKLIGFFFRCENIGELHQFLGKIYCKFPYHILIEPNSFTITFVKKKLLKIYDFLSVFVWVW